MQVLTLSIYLIGTFLIAGIPFGFLYVKLFHKKDVRTFGSGNIGATNVLRAAGIEVAVLTALSDVFKSFIPVLLSKKIFSHSLIPYLVWLTAILGHCFSPYLKFKGGKGVATFFGGLLALQPVTALITFIIWILIIAIWRYVSLGSMVASTFPAVISIIKGERYGFVVIPAIISVIILYRHKDNIKRLLSKTEHKLKLKG
ncbi:MAG: glycerol-3-phosphate 1-O-acyltransferase PlsY [bacterium]|nr:glycerol-3-phosphate 1-O-acyltransferase PlsY [bacterium]